MGEAESFVEGHARAVLTTRRRDDGLQCSPVRVLVDGNGEIVASTQGNRAKARNLERDGRFALCVISDSWSGAWMTIEGRATVEHLPEAMPALVEFFTKRDGPIADESAFAERMRSEQRVILRFKVERVATPPRAG